MLMLTVLSTIAGATAGACGFRFRGSAAFREATGGGATMARIVVWGLPLGLLWVTASNAPLAWVVVMTLALWFGAIWGWWGDLGATTARDVALLSLRGVVWVLPAALVVLAQSGAVGAVLLLLLAGLSCGLVYRIGWRLAGIGGLGGSEVAEVIFGAVIGAALVGGSAAHG